MPPDDELLRRYVCDQDQGAFAALVERYVGLVYAAALRRTGGRADDAREISQTVFATLGRKAGALRSHPTLAGWLYRTTRYAAIDAARAEGRRQALNRAMAQVPDSAEEPAAEWERLRPAIDEAMDHLAEPDRQILLMRFFDGLNFAVIGKRVGLKENAARMRVDRALERLRGHLGRLGITSTGSALAAVLASPAFAAAPAVMAGVVSAGALAVGSTAPSGAMALLLMNKITLPIFSAVLGGALTAVLWTSTVHGTSRAELAALRQDQANLQEAIEGPPGNSALVAVDASFSHRMDAVIRRLQARRAASEATSSQSAARRLSAASGRQGAVGPFEYINHGQATARDAALTFAWASETANFDVFAKLVAFDGPASRAQLAAFMATLPPWLQKEYPSPEVFFGFLCAADAIVAPPPGEDVLEQVTEEPIGPGRVRLVPGGHILQQTPDGWKWEAPPGPVLVHFAQAVLSDATLASLGAR